MMSAPMIRCVSITLSGVNRCLLPSMWLLKRTPSSVILRISLKRMHLEPAAIREDRSDSNR